MSVYLLAAGLRDCRLQGIANILWASAMLSVPDDDDDDETVARAAALRQRLTSVAASLCPRAVAQVTRQRCARARAAADSACMRMGFEGGGVTLIH